MGVESLPMTERPLSSDDLESCSSSIYSMRFALAPEGESGASPLYRNEARVLRSPDSAFDKISPLHLIRKSWTRCLSVSP